MANICAWRTGLYELSRTFCIWFESINCRLQNVRAGRTAQRKTDAVLLDSDGDFILCPCE